MTGTDWLDQLEQKAAAATAGPWHVHEMGKVFVGNGDPRSLHEIVYMSADDLADLTDKAASRERKNAEFIAAANPHTVQRLLRTLDEAGTEAMHARDLVSLLREERDDLRSKVAAIRTVLDDAPHTDVFTLDAAIRNALADRTNP